MISQITSLRFLIAFIIFVFHLKIHVGLNIGIKIIDNFLLNGATFMSGFFVLSGYIMYHIYSKNDFKNISEFRSYYIKRFAKIYPTYILATIVFTFFAIFILKQSLTSKEWALYIYNDIFLLQAFQKSYFSLMFNGGSWSISVEAFFYLCFPFIMVHEKSFQGKSLLIFACIFLIIINLNTLLSSTSNHSTSYYSYSNPIYRISEFLIGIAFCKLRNEGYLAKLPFVLKNPFFIFLMIFFLTAISLSKGKFQYGGLQFFHNIFFGLLIFAFENSKTRFLQNKVLIKLGDISYSFFLFQGIAIFVSKILSPNPYLASLSAFVLNIIFALLVYHFFEEPVRKKIIKSQISR
jgi:peptidoglycan/LPS O-acetylase OafA/YrhL